MLRRRDLLAIAGAPLIGRAEETAVIRVGCQTRAYGSPLPDKQQFLAALDGLKNAGYAGFETNYRSLEHSFDEPTAMLREIEQRGVEMIGLHVGVALFDPAKIREEHALLEHVAKGAHALGGRHIIVSGRKLPEAADGRAKPESVATKARELNRAGERCRDIGVRLSFHNHTHEVRHNAEEIRQVLDQTDPELVSLLFDVGHVHYDEVDVPAFARELGPRISGFHVRDVRGGEEVLIGTGKVDFEGLGRALHETDWKGWVIVEVNESQQMPSREMVQRARKHLRTTMRI